MSEIAEEQEEQIEELEDEFEDEEVDETVDDDQLDDDVDLEDDEQEAEEDSVEILLDDESLTSEEDNQPAPSWVKDLRKNHREEQKRNRELQRELAELKQAREATPQEAIIKKPTLEAFDYDTERYEGELARYYQQQRKVEDNKAQQDAEQKRIEQEYRAQLDNYEKSKKTLGVKDYDDAEHVVLENFSELQQNIILNGSDNAALAVYAIGKNSQRAKDLANIKDPVKFAFAVAKLEGKLKVNTRKATTSPERKVTGSGKKSGVDSTLERLEAEAARTNDMTKLYAYERKLKQKRK
jgi:hypothetical protein